MLHRLKEYLIDDRNFKSIKENYGDLGDVCLAALKNYGYYVGYTRTSSTDNSNKRTVIWNLERLIKFVGGKENLAGKTFDTGDRELGKKVAQFFIKNTNTNISDFMDNFDKALVYDEDSTKNYRENDRWAKAEIFNERLVLNAVAQAARDIDNTSTIDADDTSAWSTKASIPVIKSVTAYKGRTPKGRATIYHKIEFGDFQTNKEMIFFFLAAMNQKFLESYDTIKNGKSEKNDVGAMDSEKSGERLNTSLDNFGVSGFVSWLNILVLAIIKGIKLPVGHEKNRRTGLESQDSFNQCFFNTKEVMNFLDFNNKDFKLTSNTGKEVGIFGAIASRLFNKREESSKMATTFLGKLIHEFRDEKRNPSDCINGDLKNISLSSLERDSEDNSKLDARPLVKKAVSDWQESERESEFESGIRDILKFLITDSRINKKVKSLLSQRTIKRADVENDDFAAIEIFISIIANIKNLTKIVTSSNRFKINGNYELMNLLLKNLGREPKIQDFANKMCFDEVTAKNFINSLSGAGFKRISNLNSIAGKNGYISYFDFEEKNGEFVERTTDTYDELNKEFKDKFMAVPVSRKSIKALEDIASRLLKFNVHLSATHITNSFSLQPQSKEINFNSLDSSEYLDNKKFKTTISQVIQYIISNVNIYAKENDISGSKCFMETVRENASSLRGSYISDLLSYFEKVLKEYGVSTRFFDNFVESKKRLFNRIFMKSLKESLFDNIYSQSK